MKKIITLVIMVVLAIYSADYCKADDTHIRKNEILKLRDDDKYIGNIKAEVTIITYSSLSCPGCASFHEKVLPEIKKEYIDTGKVLYIFRDYPANEPSLYGAIFANCFSDDYFKILDILFKSQTKWAFRKDFKLMLKNIGTLSGFNAQKINQCFEDKALSDNLQMKAFKDMKALNLNQTPTIYINTYQVYSNNYDDYVKVIDKYLK